MHGALGQLVILTVRRQNRFLFAEPNQLVTTLATRGDNGAALWCSPGAFNHRSNSALVTTKVTTCVVFMQQMCWVCPIIRIEGLAGLRRRSEKLQ